MRRRVNLTLETLPGCSQSPQSLRNTDLQKYVLLRSDGLQVLYWTHGGSRGLTVEGSQGPDWRREPCYWSMFCCLLRYYIWMCKYMLNRISDADRCDFRDSHTNIEFKDRSMTFQAQFSQIQGPDTAESMIKVKRSKSPKNKNSVFIYSTPRWWKVWGGFVVVEAETFKVNSKI